MHFLITAADLLCNPSNYVVTWKPEDAIGYPAEAVLLPGSRMEFLLMFYSRTVGNSMTNAYGNCHACFKYGGTHITEYIMRGKDSRL